MKKILLIEDEMDVRETTAEILELANFEVITAPNGRDGVKLAKSDKPDLVICDIMMPEMDGYEVLYLLGKDPATSTIPFIFLSAKSEKGDIRHGMNLGADDYLTKPFEEMDLLNAIETRLAKVEVFQKEYAPDKEGMEQFFNEARGMAKLLELSEDRELKTYPKKQFLYHEDQFPYYLFLIHSGKVKTTRMNDTGKEFVTGIHSSGDFLGHMDLLQGTRHSENAEILEEAEIYMVPKEDFLALVRTNRDVSAKFIKMLSRDLIDTETELLKLAYDSVRKRTADVLLQLNDKFKTEAEPYPAISMPREDLAGMIGTAKESLIRNLSDLKSEGLISIISKKIRITDEEGLRKIRF